jgi:DNA polymerase elongation subunit (family B)
MIAFNLDYTTLVPDNGKADKVPSISDEQCHIFEWTDHRFCSLDTLKRAKKVLLPNLADGSPDCRKCIPRYFRFLKGPIGRIPTILKNLLYARKTTRNQLKQIAQQLKTETDPSKVSDLERMSIVLDKRQLSYKICANSCYGATGARKGYLPILPIAMCTTFKGRESIKKAIEYIKNNYESEGVHIIYGDTDSVYLNFKAFNTIEQIGALDGHCRRMERDMGPLFPPPMKLTYEEHIYFRYLILTKKRYMGLEASLDGTISKTISMKGVLLARRDNAKLMKDFYSKVIMKGFNKEDYSSVRQTIMEGMDQLLSGMVSPKDLSVNKSVGNAENYKIRSLDKDDQKAVKRLESMNIVVPKLEEMDINLVRRFVDQPTKTTEDEKIEFDTEYQLAQTYRTLCLPPQVQLAVKMRSRGKRVENGERLSYVMLKATDGRKYTKVYQKLEHIDYYTEHAQSLKLDYFYYLNLFVKPFDEILQACFIKDPEDRKKVVKQQRKKVIVLGGPPAKKFGDNYSEEYHVDDFKEMVRDRLSYSMVIKELEELYRSDIIEIR